MTPLLLIAAVDAEFRELRAQLETAHPLECGQRRAWRGTLGGRDVLLLGSGIGKINAAAATAVALERFAPHGVISFGSAGAYLGSGLHIGDLVLPGEEIVADEGVACADRFLDLETLGFPSVTRPRRLFNRFPAATQLHRRAQEALDGLAGELGVRLSCGSSLTVSSCSGSAQRGDELSLLWDGTCENMEGGAVAQVCSAWGVPWLEVRGISNLVEDRDPNAWDLPLAARHAQLAVKALVDTLEPKEWSE